MGGPDELDAIRIAPLTRLQAADICTWRYPAPYDLYDMDRATPDELLAPEADFHAVTVQDRLVGFRSFGPDGQVPGWDYDDTALDTGGGLRPDLIGQGIGRAVIWAGLEFGRERFAPPAFRVTVAAFNDRALTVVQSLGFEPLGTFNAVRDAREFHVLVRHEATSMPRPPRPHGS